MMTMMEMKMMSDLDEATSRRRLFLSCADKRTGPYEWYQEQREFSAQKYLDSDLLADAYLSHLIEQNAEAEERAKLEEKAAMLDVLIEEAVAEEYPIHLGWMMVVCCFDENQPKPTNHDEWMDAFRKLIKRSEISHTNP